jgi:prepilin-type N-terminal cleavage/methylation domain-containing protein
MFNLKRRRGFSLIELLIVIAIILIIITVALPKLTRARMYAQEVAAIQAIKTIHTGQVSYFSQFGRYAVSLAELGPPASGAASGAAADFIGNDLSNGKKQGYIFTVAAVQGGYTVSAVPETFGNTGSRTFFSDQSMVVHEHYGPEPATAQDPEMK